MESLATQWTRRKWPNEDLDDWKDPADDHLFDLADETPHAPHEPYRAPGRKTGRNAHCPCGSGKKYKKCCGR